MDYRTSFGKEFSNYNDYIAALLRRENLKPSCYEFYPNQAKHRAERAKLEDSVAPDFGYDDKE